MSASTFAVGWSLWQRHRRGLTAVAIAFAFSAIASAAAQTLLEPDLAIQVTAFASLPLVIAGFYGMAVFAFGFDADLAAAGTCFPTRMFTLPVRTIELAAWPILCGTVFLSVLWLAAAGLLLRPWGYAPPWLWPALLPAALLVWSQALLWWPFGLPWMRVVVGVLLVHIPVTGTMILREFGYSDSVVVAFLAVSVLVGVVLAHAGVARARRGSVPSWALGWPARRITKRSARTFASALRAHTWYESRRGIGLPLIVGGMLAITLWPLFFDGVDPKSILFVVTAALLTPVYIAGLVGGAGKHNPWSREAHTLPSFLATRPMSTAGLVAAKLRAAARTTLTTWAIVLLAVGAALWSSGHHRLVRETATKWAETHSRAEIAVTLLVATALLFLTTWKRQVESKLLGLTGREWVGRVSVFLTLSLFVAGMMFLAWFTNHPEKHGALLDALPWVLATLVALKFALGAAAIRALRRRRLLTDQTLALWALAWLAAFAALFGPLAWLVPATMVAPYQLALGVILTLPLARLAAMPLALNWNRHR